MCFGVAGYSAVKPGLMQLSRSMEGGGALRDDTKNDCVADYQSNCLQ